MASVISLHRAHRGGTGPRKNEDTLPGTAMDKRVIYAGVQASLPRLLRPARQDVRSGTTFAEEKVSNSSAMIKQKAISPHSASLITPKGFT